MAYQWSRLVDSMPTVSPNGLRTFAVELRTNADACRSLAPVALLLDFHPEDRNR